MLKCVPLLILIVLLTLAAFYFKEDLKKEETKQILPQTQQELLAAFIQNNYKKFLDNAYYESINIQDKETIVSFKSLNNKKQIIFRLKCLHGTKKELKKLFEQTYEKTSEETQCLMRQFELNINNKIDNETKILYLEYGQKIHLADKLFLDNINE